MQRSTRIASLLTCLLALSSTACAPSISAPAPGRSTLAGRVTLVEPDALRAAGGGDAYGDRRLRGVERVDYSQTGFAVVHLDASAGSATGTTADPTVLALADGVAEPRFEPADLALAEGSTLVLRNRSRSAHVVSIPGLAVVAELAPGDELARVVATPGEHTVHLLDHPGVAARLFAAPGPFARVTSSGRFEIADLPPGRHVVHVFHPRLPPASREVVLEADRVLEVELALGVTPTAAD